MKFYQKKCEMRAIYWLSVKEIEGGGGAFFTIRHFKIAYNDFKC